MIDYIKKLFLRLCLSGIIIFVLLFIFEFILDKTSNAWYNENDKINNMNFEKLQNTVWLENATWLHKGEEILPKKKGTKRILIVGDSYIWGDGYSNANHIWWQQFKHLLKEKGYHDVEVFAAGLCGYNTYQELEFILKQEDVIKKIDPDFIVIGYVSNDMEPTDDYGNHFVKVLISDNIFYYFDNTAIKLFKLKFPNIYRQLSILLSEKFYNNSKFNEMFGSTWDDWQQTISSGNWIENYENRVLSPLTFYMKYNLNIPYFIYGTNVEEYSAIYNIKESFKRYNINFYYFLDLAEELNIDILQGDDYRKINPVNWHPSVYDGKLFAEGLLYIFEKDYSHILGEKNGKYEPALNINDWIPYSLKPKKIDDNSYTITYPGKNSKNSFLYLPVNKNYIKLNLEDPLDIKNIKITGDNIEEIEIFVNCIDETLGFDTQKMFSLGTKNNKFYWDNIDIKNITSINISAKIKGDNSSDLTIEIH